MVTDLLQFFRAGGWVMYPLLLLSLVSVTLSVERAAFWLRTHSPGARRRLARVMAKVRAGETTAAIAIAEQSGSIYMRFAAGLLDHATRTHADKNATETAALELIEDARPIIERFSVVLSTIVTAAPLLGILGTVTGIIQSFRLLGGAETVTDPAAVAAGIAQALYTTAFGLIVALVTLFPYVIFRSQGDRCLGRLETVGATIAEHTPQAQARAASDAAEPRATSAA
jgi:biopolymer transport protein ExbB